MRARSLYVDRLVGELLNGMRGAGTFDGTTIVLFADHGYRFGGRERDPMHVPFIVKMARQKQATQDATATRGAAQGNCQELVQGRLKPALRRDTPRPRPYTSLNGD